MANSKCHCNIGILFLTIILITAGIYFLVWGFLVQTIVFDSSINPSSFSWRAIVFYLVGVFLFLCGKMFKSHGTNACELHRR